MIRFSDTAIIELQRIHRLGLQRPVNIRDLAQIFGLSGAPCDAAARADHKARMTEQSTLVDDDLMVTFSYEIGHPCGDALHMSCSTKLGLAAPPPDDVWALAQTFGFAGALADCVVFIETTADGTRAVNLIQPVDQAALRVMN